MEQEKDFLTLEYDDGTECECEILGTFEADGKEYIALAPQNDSNDVFIYRFIQLEDDFELEDIIDEEEFEKAVKEFDRIMEEE